MNCSRARETLPELADGRTPASAHPDVRSHLAGCPDCQREFAALTATAAALDTMPLPAPTPRLRQNFYAMLEAEKQAVVPAAEPAPSPRVPISRRSGSAGWRWLLSPLVGCALIALGFFAGQRSQPAAPTPVADDSTKRELVALREQITEQRDQLNKMTTLVGYSLLQQQQSPANSRLQEVLVAAKAPNVNDRVLAVEALYPHAERELVRAGVLAALPREQNPLVQLELIDFVAAARDRNAAPVLETLSADETTNQTVRQAARLALSQF
jgi:predicted anti-sigma-YlaC factor YlaD